MAEQPKGATESINPLVNMADFHAQLERVLKPVLSDGFSEETKKTRNLVLVTGLVTILLVFGVVAVANDSKFQAPLIGLEIKIGKGLIGVLVALCAYFTIVLAYRSYADWQIWMLAFESGEAELEELKGATRSAEKMLLATLLASATTEVQVGSKQTNLRELPGDLAARHQANTQRLNEIAMRDLGQGGIGEFWDVLEESDEIRREIASHRQTIAPELELLQRQATEARDVYRSALKSLVVRSDMTEKVGRKRDPIRKLVTVRQWLDVIFPLAFGVVAIGLGLIAILAGVVVGQQPAAGYS